ncbi:hypothetical protein VTL71DRAFT_14430 [Oculimacula yallundae]|uniref:Uncharacterized protein n=1 Tax=Oculimacula yallundae TaxID=86028 RepID=A0ABR4CKJ3_9HELO
MPTPPLIQSSPSRLGWACVSHMEKEAESQLQPQPQQPPITMPYIFSSSSSQTSLSSFRHDEHSLLACNNFSLAL